MSKAVKNINILYLDDEIMNLETFKALLRRDHNIFISETVEEAKSILKSEDIHILFSDQRMPKMTGVEFFESILEDHPKPIRILTTAYTDVNCVIDSINKGQVYKYIEKPWNIDCLKATIIQAYEIYCLRESNEKLIFDLKSFNEELIKINKQLEFMLQQKNLS
jgi:response regulator RpfG family c-di-GMP phosphodiesterase